MKKIIIIGCILLISLQSYAQNIEELNALIIEENFDEAAVLGKLLCIGDKNNAELFYLTGSALKQIDDYKEAEIYFKKAYDLNSTKSKYIHAYAGILTNNERYLRAVEIYKRILANNPANNKALRNLSSIYIKKEKFSEALKLYKKLSELNPEISYYYRMSGNCYLKKDEKDSALLLFKTAYLNDSNDIQNIKQLSVTYYNRKEFKNCISYAKKGIKIDSLCSDCYRIGGQAFFYETEYKDAYVSFRKVVELGDSSDLTNTYIGKSLFALQEFRKSLPYIKAAYSKDTTNANLTHYLAKIYYKLERYDDAEHFYRKTLSLLTPSSTTLYLINLDLAQILYELKNYKESLYYYNQKVKYNREVIKYRGITSSDHYFLALVHEKLKNYKTALHHYERFIKLFSSEENDFEEDIRYKYAKQQIVRIKEELHLQGN